MVTTARKLMTAEELEAMPDDDMRHELVAGRLITMPPTSHGHSRVAGRITRLLNRVPDLDQIGETWTADVGFRLASDPDTVRAPDLSFVRRDRLLPLGEARGFAAGAPAVVVEVLSPDDRPKEVQRKIEDYLGAGTELIWIVDPRRRTVTIHEPSRELRNLGGDDEIDGGNVLPGFKARVSDFFPS